jgi:hypothetical protein
VTGDVNPVVAGLVKIQTGLAQVSAAGYLKQADEIFAKGNVSTEGLSHPEAFIRARALTLWQEKRENATAQIVEMIEGAAALDELDLPGQAVMAGKTRRLLEWFLQPKWIQTPAVLGHARLFFDDFKPSATRQPAGLLHELKADDQKTVEFFCYLLLDFVTADPELDEMPLAAALQVCELLGLENQFEKLAARELKMKARDMKRLKEQATEMLAKAEANGE